MISSTFEDLRDHRQILKLALQKEGMLPIAMEHSTLRPNTNLVQDSLAMVRRSQAYIVLIGHSYGRVPEHDNPNRHSITRLEFEEANVLGKPTLVFVMGKEHLVRADQVELDSENRLRLEDFRTRVRACQVVREFNSLEEFKESVIHAVANLRESLQVDSPIAYWDSVDDRNRTGCDPRSMIGSSRSRVFLSGITLTYMFEHGAPEIRSALDRGLPVEFVVAPDTRDSYHLYERYRSSVREHLPLAHQGYRRFYERLSNARANLFKVYATPIPLTHSHGLYDQRLFIREFCIDVSSSSVPSYELLGVGKGHLAFMAEIRTLLEEGTLVVGRGESQVLKTLR